MSSPAMVRCPCSCTADILQSTVDPSQRAMSSILIRPFLSQSNASLPDDEILRLLLLAKTGDDEKEDGSSSSSSSPQPHARPGFDLYSLNMRTCTLQVFSSSSNNVPVPSPTPVVWSRLSPPSPPSQPFGVLQVLLGPTPSSPSSSSPPAPPPTVLRLITYEGSSLSEFHTAIVRTVTAISCRTTDTNTNTETNTTTEENQDAGDGDADDNGNKEDADDDGNKEDADDDGNKEDDDHTHKQGTKEEDDDDEEDDEDDEEHEGRKGDEESVRYEDAKVKMGRRGKEEAVVVSSSGSQAKTSSSSLALSPILRLPVVPLDPVAADGWDFFQLICSLHLNKLRYVAVFQLDVVTHPAYKYLNALSFETGREQQQHLLGGGAAGAGAGGVIFDSSCTSFVPFAVGTSGGALGGGVGVGGRGGPTPLLQSAPPASTSAAGDSDQHHLSSSQIASYLHGVAALALPVFTRLVCKVARAVSTPRPSSSSSLGFGVGVGGGPSYGIGPLKTVASALSKASRLYGGNVLRVTDFVRGTIVLDDLSHLVAALEYLSLRFGDIILRIDVSRIEAGGEPYAGGYRDATATVNVLGHLCELSFTISSMWAICSSNGFRHYKHSRELSIDTLESPSVALKNMTISERNSMIRYVESCVLRRRAMKGLGQVADVKADDEVGMTILFAEGLLLLEQRLYAWAEFIFRTLGQLRKENDEYSKFPGDIHPVVREIRRLQASAQAPMGGAENSKPGGGGGGGGGGGPLESRSPTCSEDAEDARKFNASIAKIIDDCKRRKFDVDAVKKEWNETKGREFLFLRE